MQTNWTNETVFAVLANPVSMFSQLSKETMVDLLSISKITPLKAGHTVATTNAVVDTFIIILDGMLRVHNYSAQGNEHIVSFLEPGNAFGFISCVDRQPNPHNVLVDTDSTVMAIPAHDLRKLVTSNAEFCTLVLNFFCTRLRLAFVEMDEYAIGTPRIRLTKRLIYLAQTMGLDEVAGGVSLKLTQDSLGAMIGLSRQGTNKLLNQFAEQGLISRDYGKIIIHDVAMLEHSLLNLN